MRNTIIVLVIILLTIPDNLCRCETDSAAASTKSEESDSIVYCVAPLSNNTGDEQFDALGEGFADMLMVTLAQVESVRIVERQKLYDLLKEQKLSLLGLTDTATAVKVGKLLSADRILVGGITKKEEKLIVNIHSYETETTRLITSVEVQGKTTDIFSMVNHLIDDFDKSLDIKLEPLDPNDIDKNPNASLHFIRGLGFYYCGNHDSAIVEFMKTQDLDQTSDKACYWLAICFMSIKEYEHAIIELENLLNRFPESSLRMHAQKKMTDCKRQHDQ